MQTHRKTRSRKRFILITLLILLLVWLLIGLNGAEFVAIRLFPNYQEKMLHNTMMSREKEDLVKEAETLSDRNLKYSMLIDMLIEENRSLRERDEISQYWIKDPELAGVTARIFLKDPYGLYPTFLVDKGSNDGIEKNMPVLGLTELIGRVIEVHPEFSRIRTIESPKLAFGAVVRRTNELGVYLGGRKDKSLTYLSINSDISPGDEIITSGTTDITPSGLRLGKVKEVIRRAPEEELVVTIESSENIAVLSHVWILTRIRDVPDDASLSEGQS